MGVQGILTRLLPSVGTELDLNRLKLIHIENKKNGDISTGTISRSKRRVRAAIDVSSWIAQACHGRGTDLMDERHLTNYGRAQLKMMSKKNDESTKSHCDSDSHVLDNPQTARFVSNCAGFVMSKIFSLQQDLDIVVIFDGQTPPIKKNESNLRSKKRKAAALIRDDPNLEDTSAKDEDKHDAGKAISRLKAARRAGASSPIIYGSIVQALLNMLRMNKIHFIVAPYEADGQLAYLSKKKLVDLVITEDSDIIAYGTLSMLFKLDNQCQKGIFIERKNIGCCQQLDLFDFSDVMLATLFVAAGCDYCHSLPGIGIKTAQSIVRDAFHPRNRRYSFRYKPVLSIIFGELYRNMRGKALSDEDKYEYEQKFLGALLMYRHPLVYDIDSDKCIFMNNPSTQSDPELMDYEPYAQICSDKAKLSNLLGETFHSEKSALITQGWVNPRTGKIYPFDNIPPHVLKAYKVHFTENKDMNTPKSQILKEGTSPSPISKKIVEDSLPKHHYEVNELFFSQSTGQSSSSASKALTQGSSSSDIQGANPSPDLLPLLL